MIITMYYVLGHFAITEEVVLDRSTLIETGRQPVFSVPKDAFIIKLATRNT